jgi:hypothetical protein
MLNIQLSDPQLEKLNWRMVSSKSMLPRCTSNITNPTHRRRTLCGSSRLRQCAQWTRIGLRDLRYLTPGQAAPVLSLSQDGEWWEISIPATYSPDGIGWLSADYVILFNSENQPIPQPLE